MLKAELAAWAESEVQTHLESKGHLTLAKNIRHLGFEVDLVTLKQGALVITEVKARSFQARRCLKVEELLGRQKKRALKRGALFLINQYRHLNISWFDFYLSLVLYEKKSLTDNCFSIKELRVYKSLGLEEGLGL